MDVESPRGLSPQAVRDVVVLSVEIEATTHRAVIAVVHRKGNRLDAIH